MTPDRTDFTRTGVEAPEANGPLRDMAAVAQLDEFPEGATEFTDEVSRRRFMTIMGASLALAGAAGCNLRPAPQRKIVPYTTQPDEITPGVPLFFASAAPLGGYGSGILVRSNEGRPTKIEGNPDHPSSRGGASLFSLGSLLDLYDPDRSSTVLYRGLESGYDLAVAAIRKELDTQRAADRRGRGLRIVTETVTSPTFAAQMEQFLTELPEARWVQHDPIGRDNIHQGAALAFGKPQNVIYDFAKADVVVALDSDFLCSGPGHVRYSRDFATRRKIRNEAKDGVRPEAMSRLYVVESMPSNSGSVADHRLSLLSSGVEAFARSLLASIKDPSAQPDSSLPENARAWIRPLADDLRDLARKGKSIIVAGDHQPAAVHALAHAINSLLDNFNKTVFVTAPVEVRPTGKVDDLKKLTEDMSAKQVETILILGSNPAYTAPADLPFAEQLKNVPFRVHFGSHLDETAVLCEWHVPEAHYLETWGDIRGHDGTVSIQQPLIAPLYRGKSMIEFLADLTAGPFRDGLDIVKAYWRNAGEVKKRFPGYDPGATFEVFWQESVRSGVVAGTAAKAEEKPTSAAPPAATPVATMQSGEFEINFRADPTLYDGRYANNGWLQECPKPLTKMTWDNAVYMSPTTAARLKVDKSFPWTGGEHGRADVSVVELTLNGRKVTAPVWILPGHCDGALTVHLGYGRERGGRVTNSPNEPNAEGKPVRGFNAYSLRTDAAPWYAPGASLKVLNKTYFLACTQGQWRTTQRDPITGIEMDRRPVRFGSLADYKRDPAFAKIPPTAAGETHLINENIPGPKARPHDHKDDHKKDDHKKDDHKEDHKEDHGGHDSRLHPLTMYNPSTTLSPDLAEAQQRRWAMAVDLSACTGCSACVVACVGENNTPVIGKYEVTRGRAMHWINIDRYYVGAIDRPDDLQTHFQPRMCVQCENAPCEVVCPVGATVHSTDGLNDMAFNRCVGTRYCSNNCPYKVRRFNFLSYDSLYSWSTSTLKLGRNPDVSVRSRGVMEKCTFCVQRIRGAEIVAERESRPIHDGEIITACQSACPSGAIVFGDLNDASSVVSRWRSEPTNYGLLAELNTRPRLTHMAVLRNPNPAMPKGA